MNILNQPINPGGHPVFPAAKESGQPMPASVRFEGLSTQSSTAAVGRSHAHSPRWQAQTLRRASSYVGVEHEESSAVKNAEQAPAEHRAQAAAALAPFQPLTLNFLRSLLDRDSVSSIADGAAISICRLGVVLSFHLLPPRNALPAGVFLLLASSWAPLASALDIEYCASFNTGSTPRNSSIYQTNGLCHDFCIDDYAFAITQDKLCWCSNYVPSKSTQEDTSKCDTPCPAWPSENCGGDGLYGYVSLGNVLPSGTQGPSSSSSKTTTESEEETSTSTEEESTSTTTEAPTSLVQTVTAGGTVKTVTVAPTQSATAGVSANENANEKSQKSGLSTGQVVGIVVGVIVAVLGLAALVLFIWFRRKKQQNEQEAYHDDPSIRDSSSGIAQRPDMSMAAGSPVSAAGASNRNSTLQVDPRMDPFKQGLYVRSASHESINTLRDDHDYSRKIQAPKVLRATNPDPTPGA